MNTKLNQKLKKEKRAIIDDWEDDQETLEKHRQNFHSLEANLAIRNLINLLDQSLREIRKSK